MSRRISQENLENVAGHINDMLKRKKSPYRILLQYQYGKVYACKAKETPYEVKGKKEVYLTPVETSFTAGTKAEVYESLHSLLLGMRLLDEVKEDRKRFKRWEEDEKRRNAYLAEESRKAHEANKKADMEENV